MSRHSDPVQGSFTVPWEALGQISPSDLPSDDPRYPRPWTFTDRGNGHHDVIDAQGRTFAHVYCWDAAEFRQLLDAVRSGA